MQPNKIQKNLPINTILTNPIRSMGAIRGGLFLSLLMVSQPSLAMESKSKLADKTSEQSLAMDSWLNGENETTQESFSDTKSVQANTQVDPGLELLRLQINGIKEEIKQSNENKNIEKLIKLYKTKMNQIYEIYEYKNPKGIFNPDNWRSANSEIAGPLLELLDEVSELVTQKKVAEAEEICHIIKNKYIEWPNEILIEYLNLALAKMPEPEKRKVVFFREVYQKKPNNDSYTAFKFALWAGAYQKMAKGGSEDLKPADLLEELATLHKKHKKMLDAIGTWNILIERTADPSLKGYYLLNAAEASDEIGEEENADQYYLQAQKCYQRANKQEKTEEILYTLAKRPIKSNDPNRLIQIVNKLNDPSLKGDFLLKAAQISVEIDKEEDADQHYLQAQKCYQTANKPEKTEKLLYALAERPIKSNNPNRLIQIVNKLNDPSLKGDFLLKAAEISVEIGKEENADKYYLQAEEYYQIANKPEKIEKILHILAERSIENNNPNRLIQIVDSLKQTICSRHAGIISEKRNLLKTECYAKIEDFFKEKLLKCIKENNASDFKNTFDILDKYSNDFFRTDPQKKMLEGLLLNFEKPCDPKNFEFSSKTQAVIYEKIVRLDRSETEQDLKDSIDTLKNLKNIYADLESRFPDNNEYKIKKASTNARLAERIEQSYANISQSNGLTPAEKTSKQIECKKNQESAYRDAGKGYHLLVTRKPEKADKFLKKAISNFKSLSDVQNTLARLDASKKIEHMQSSAYTDMAIGQLLTELSRRSQPGDDRFFLLDDAKDRFEQAGKGYFVCEDRKKEADAFMARSNVLRELASNTKKKKEGCAFLKEASASLEQAGKGYFVCGDRKREADAFKARSNVLETLSKHIKTDDERSKLLNEASESLTKAIEAYKFSDNKDSAENAASQKLQIDRKIEELLPKKKSEESPTEKISSTTSNYGYGKVNIKDESTWELRDEKGNIKPRDYSIDPMDAY
jgi:hypothetical protein